MPARDRLQLARDAYGAYESGDRSVIDALLSDEVLVTYESTKTDGKRFRNTEILTFEGDKIRKVEVYFGWDLE